MRKEGVAFAASTPMSKYKRYAGESHWPALSSCAKLPPVSNIDLAAAALMLWVRAGRLFPIQSVPLHF